MTLDSQRDGKLPSQETAPNDFFTQLDHASTNLAEAIGYDIGFKWKWADMIVIEKGTNLWVKLQVDAFMLKSKTLSMALDQNRLHSGLQLRAQNYLANEKKTLIQSLKDSLTVGVDFYDIPEEKTKFLLRGTEVAATRLLQYSNDKNRALSTACRETAADTYDMIAQFCGETGGSPLDKMKVDKFTGTIRAAQDITQLLPIISTFSKDPPFLIPSAV